MGWRRRVCWHTLLVCFVRLGASDRGLLSACYIAVGRGISRVVLAERG